MWIRQTGKLWKSESTSVKSSLKHECFTAVFGRPNRSFSVLNVMSSLVKSDEWPMYTYSASTSLHAADKSPVSVLWPSFLHRSDKTLSIGHVRAKYMERIPILSVRKSTVFHSLGNLNCRERRRGGGKFPSGPHVTSFFFPRHVPHFRFLTHSLPLLPLPPLALAYEYT